MQCSYAGSPPTNGSYGPPIYSGGTQTTYQFPGGTKYGLQTSGYGGGGSGPAECSGQITVKFNWNPGTNNTLPPDSVIVEQTSSASWSSPFQDGSCDDGLGDPEKPSSTPIPYGPYPIMYSGISKGTSYSCVKPASDGSITIQCTPFAFEAFGGPSQAVVSYSASISNLSIVASGVTTVNGEDDILVGQMCHGTLALPAGYLVLNPKWTVSGTIYKSWGLDTKGNSDLVSVVPTDWSGTITQTGFSTPAAYTLTSPSWFWDDPNSNSETISCTATIQPPSGSPFTLNI